MERQTTTERTPLVTPPTYVFESSLSRNYQKRLRNFQCAVCVGLITILGVALLVTVSYDLAADFADDNNTETPITEGPATEPPAPATQPPRILNLTSVTPLPPELQPLLALKWPLQGKPPASWVGNSTTLEDISIAVKHGQEALSEKRKVENKRRPLAVNTPASRAQRAAATSMTVKPLADVAYAAEVATRALVNGTDSSKREGGVGIGPLTNTSFEEPPYCQTSPLSCPHSKYRTINGTCNNLNNPLRWGVSNTPFRRVLPADYGDGISSPRTGVNGAPLPSARDVSVTVHRASYAHDSSFTVMLAVWGQFIDHDITATALSKGENGTSLACCDETQPPHPECFPVSLDVEDPYYEGYNLTCMEFVRSASAPTCHFGPREQMNQASGFLDGSTVYGWSEDRTQRLRSGVDGQLRMLKFGTRELLPQSTDPNDGCNTVEMNAKGRYCFESGDDRANENLHLTTMHLLLARQHNRLATILKGLNPTWDDETLFQEARKIVGAQMQHITYSEFLPPILGLDVMYALNLTLKTDGFSDDYDPNVDPSLANHFSASAFRFAHTLLPGLIHNVDSNKGTVSYIHLHEILFNPYTLYGPQGTKIAVNSAINTNIHTADPHVTSELSNHLFERPVVVNSTTNITKSGPCGLDLISLNIQRGRDHGLPPYPAWREHCGYPRPTTFEELQEIFDPISYDRIETIYNNVDDIDLYTGGLAEAPNGRLLGPTITCLVSDQFLRLKIGDRFWYETSDTTVGFTLEQLTEIRKTTLAGLICSNEDLLDQMQPRVMEEVSASNPLMDCMEIPQPDFTPWAESSKTSKKYKGAKSKKKDGST